MTLIENFGQYLLKVLPIINYTTYKNELSIKIPFNKIIPIYMNHIKKMKINPFSKKKSN